MTVESILKTKGTDVVTIRPTATIADAAQALAEGKFGILVVSENGTAVEGILSERDIVQALARHGASTLDLSVDQVMTRDVIICSRKDRINDMMAVMSQKRIRHLPVVEDGKLAGVISMTDAMRARIDDVEHEATALRDFIAGH